MCLGGMTGCLGQMPGRVPVHRAPEPSQLLHTSTARWREKRGLETEGLCGRAYSSVARLCPGSQIYSGPYPGHLSPPGPRNPSHLSCPSHPVTGLPQILQPGLTLPPMSCPSPQPLHSLSAHDAALFLTFHLPWLPTAPPAPSCPQQPSQSTGLPRFPLCLCSTVPLLLLSLCGHFLFLLLDSAQMLPPPCSWP